MTPIYKPCDPICGLPPLDYVTYGEQWTCPECGTVWTKDEFDSEGAWWEKGET